MTALLWRTALRRGLFGGSRAWMTILAVAASVRLFRRISGSVPETVYCEPLRPGEALIVTHHDDQRLGDKLR